MEFVAGNRLKLLRTGDRVLSRRSKRRSTPRGDEIYLETYIFADDATGRRIADALAREAAARGVRSARDDRRLRLASDFARRFATALLAAGVRRARVPARHSPLRFQRASGCGGCTASSR